MINRITYLFFFITIGLWSKTPELELFFEHTKNQDFVGANATASNSDNQLLKSHLIYLAQLLGEQFCKTPRNILDEPNDSKEIRLVKYLISGYENSYALKQDNLTSYKKISDALKLADDIGNKIYIKAALIAMLDLFKGEIFIGSKQFEPYLQRFIELKSDTTDEALIIFYNLIFFTKADDDVDTIDSRYYNYYNKLDSLFAKFPEPHNFYPRYYYEKGIYHRVEGDLQKSEDFFLKADSVASGNEYMNTFRGGIAWQLASTNLMRGKIIKAKQYLDIFRSSSKKLRDTFYINRLSSLIFQKEGNSDSAYYYLRKSVDIEYQLGYKNNTLESSILTVQNQTDKLKLDKLELDAQSRKNRNWATALGLLLVFGGALAFLIHSNTKRKQLLAEQQKTLQEQKVATLLKEQELTTIDAMIEGQEKERQRIANDLHDDLGGLMATVKLHFNSLHSKIKDDTDELYKKTNQLIDEAYEKIRVIAHAKNSGVIAKQGLLKAVEQMAEKVSAANGISIEVKDFGLDNRMENSLELTLFRIIQELITNIIKHGQAAKANIHLTNHGDTLNILVEDNGIGFNTHKIPTESSGMGLKSIDKRVAHLEGTLHIESEPGKGATVIIDIPL